MKRPAPAALDTAAVQLSRLLDCDEGLEIADRRTIAKCRHLLERLAHDERARIHHEWEEGTTTS